MFDKVKGVRESVMKTAETEDNIEFITEPEHYGVIPDPVPAADVLPEWYKSIQTRMPKELPLGANKTVQSCMSFLDSMSLGYILKTPADIHWKVPNPKTGHAPPTFEHNSHATFDVIDTHPPQMVGTTEDGAYPGTGPIVQILNKWLIKTPPGYSCLLTHPMNRPDPRFQHFSGVVETDRYFHETNGACLWTAEPGTEGIMEKGTPYLQVIPFERGGSLDKAVVRQKTGEEQLETKRKFSQTRSEEASYKNNDWIPKGTRVQRKDE